MPKKKVPAAPSVRRLPSYLHIIKKAQYEGEQYISATFIAEELDLEPIQVRKDLTITGIVGTPKLGYQIIPLIRSIEEFLGWNKEKHAFIIGAGNLGAALSGYQGFIEHGLNICALFDIDNNKIGKYVHGLPIFNIAELPEKYKQYKPTLAILTVPSSHAQQASDSLVQVGIKAIWNFTNVKINVPEKVIVQKEDLTSGYAMLGVMINNNN